MEKKCFNIFYRDRLRGLRGKKGNKKGIKVSYKIKVENVRRYFF